MPYNALGDLYKIEVVKRLQKWDAMSKVFMP